jgi:DNA-directed RNA polymerase specialized sigma24 family protein
MIMEAFEAGVGWTPNVRSASNRSMEAINDAVECVSRMAAGDSSAVAERYAAQAPKPYAYALRLTGNPAPAEDVTQEARVVDGRTAGRYRGGARVRGCPVGTIKSRLSYAKTRLKDVLAGAGAGAGEMS